MSHWSPWRRICMGCGRRFYVSAEDRARNFDPFFCTMSCAARWAENYWRALKDGVAAELAALRSLRMSKPLGAKPTEE